MGYFTKHGNPIDVDTYGRKVLLKAYCLDEENKTFELLGHKRPMELLCEVQATLTMHRKGWASGGETLIDAQRAKLYRTRSSHILVGPKWTKIKLLRNSMASSLHPPLLSMAFPSESDLWATRSTKLPWHVTFTDADVKACSRAGRKVDLYSIERREYTDFTLSKLTLSMVFPSEGLAKKLAEDFPRTTNLADLDPTVSIDVDRSRKMDLSMKTKVALAALFILLLVVSYPMIAIPLSSGDVGRIIAGVGIVGMFSGLAGIGVYAAVRHERKEMHDLKEKWPVVAMERWAKDAQGHASGFVYAMKDMGVELNLETGDMTALDSYLRNLPNDTLFGAFAWSAAAFAGTLLTGIVGPGTSHEWVYSPHDGLPLLNIRFGDTGIYVSPFHWIKAIWQDKEPTTLNQYVEDMAENVLLTRACSNFPIFVAMGFVEDDGAEMDKFVLMVKSEAQDVEAESFVLSESHFRRRIKEWGPFQIHYFEVEAVLPSGIKFLPSNATPFYKDLPRLRGQLEATAPQQLLREDIAHVRFEKAEMLPVGMQVINYVEVGPRFTEMAGTLEFEVLAMADEAHVLTKRMRETRPDLKDAIAPLESDQEGLPISPVVQFVGRMASVESRVNPVSNIQMWQIDVNIEGMNLRVLVRKDRCRGHPEKGHFISGSAWLTGQIVSKVKPLTDYIG